MSMRKSERLQVLLDPAQSSRLRREAADRGVSVATVVRAAIDRELGVGDDVRRAALARLMAAAPMRVPDDPAELEREIETMYDR